MAVAMRALRAAWRLGLGKPYRRASARRQAHEHPPSPTALFRELDVRLWIEQAEPELKELR